MVVLTANEEITILRNESFKDVFFINNGTLIINGKDIENKIILDGNKKNVIAVDRIIQVGNTGIIGNLTLSNVVIQNNNNTSSSKNGGAIWSSTDSIVTLNNVEILNNECSGSNGGGAIFNRGTLTLNHSTIAGNVAKKNGGGLYGYAESNIILNNVKILNNGYTVDENQNEIVKTVNGGGIYIEQSGSCEISEGMISGNQAKCGGGIFWNKGRLVINGNDWSISEAGESADLAACKIENNKADYNNSLTANSYTGDYTGNNLFPYDWYTNLEFETVEEDNYNLECIGRINNKYMDHTIGDKKYIQQGMTASDKYILLARLRLNGSEVNNDGILTIISRELLQQTNNLEEAILKDFDINEYYMGHLNNATYNEDTRKFYAVDSKKLSEIEIKYNGVNIDDIENIEDIKNNPENITIEINQITIERALGGLTYDSKEKCFIGTSSGNFYKIPIEIQYTDDGKATIKTTQGEDGTRKLTAIKWIVNGYAPITGQDLEDYGGYLYFCRFEMGNSKYQTKYYKSTDDRYLDGLIYIYDLNGILQKILHIPNKMIINGQNEKMRRIRRYIY